MTDRGRQGEEGASAGYGWSYEEHRRRQTRRGLEMSPAERLRWLEETMAELREIQGRASRERRGPRPAGTAHD